jgi:hypothetical protein
MAIPCGEVCTGSIVFALVVPSEPTMVTVAPGRTAFV